MTKLATKDDLAAFGTEPVPAQPYFDPDYLKLEREAVFRRTWLAIGRADEVPEAGTYIVRDIEILGVSILVVRGKDMAVRAFFNVCPHRGMQLVSTPAGRAPALVCPYHRWTFALDGGVRAIPDKGNFFAIDEQDCNLRSIHLGEVGGFLFVCVGEPECSLEAFLGEAATVLRNRDTASYDTYAEMDNVIAANWKTAQDNFQESYHVGSIHKTTLVPMVTSPANPRGYPWYEVYGDHHRMRMWRNFDFVPPAFSGIRPAAVGNPAGPAPDGDNGGDGLDVLVLFPNFHVNSDLGRYFTHQFWPIAPGLTRLVGRIYMRKARTARERVVQEFMVSATRDVWSEDLPLLQGVQKGISAGALDQIHFQAHEFPCRHTYNGVATRVERYRRAQPAGARE